MLDLFMPPNAQKLVQRATVSRVHYLDKKPPSNVSIAMLEIRETKREQKERVLQKRLEKQSDIVRTIEVYARDGPITLEQIVYMGGFGNNTQDKANMLADLTALYERGIIGMRKTQNPVAGNPVWVYWVKGRS